MPERALKRWVVAGTSFRCVGFDRLAALSVPAEDAEVLRAVRAAIGATELVLVATCNRLEAYAILGPDAPLDPRPRLAAALRDLGAVDAAAGDLSWEQGPRMIAHLFGVVSSLQSLALGECEIAGQARRAAERAQDAGVAGDGLATLFRGAARVAQRVRRETAIGRTPVSVASLAIRSIRDHFGRAPLRRAVLVGVGDMTRKVANALRDRAELLFVNRTEERAGALAAQLGGRAQSLAAFRAAPPSWLDVLVTATGATAPVLRADDLAPALQTRAGQPDLPPLLLCDLGLPPDVDPAVRSSRELRRLNLADLEPIAAENQARLAGEAAQARRIVEAEAAACAQTLAARQLADDGVEALVAGRLAHLSPADRELVRRFSRRLAQRVASAARSA